MSFPFEIVDVDSAVNKRLMAEFIGETRGWVQVGPKKYVYNARYREIAAEVYNMPLRSDDTWLFGFPRSGTTFVQEMMWQIQNDLDFDVGGKRLLNDRFPQIEWNSNVNVEMKNEILAKVRGNPLIEARVNNLDKSMMPMLEKAPGPRYLKSHIALSLLPPALPDTCKMVYVCRNPKDVSVSLYHLTRLMRTHHYVGDFATFWDFFENNQSRWCPYWEHVKEAWELKDHPNFLFLFFEDVVKDLAGTVRTIASHLGKNLTEEQVQKLANHVHIDNFRKNPAVNMENTPNLVVQNSGTSFVRKGQNDTWKEELFTPELSARADKWISENLAKMPADFAFPTKK